MSNADESPFARIAEDVRHYAEKDGRTRLGLLFVTRLFLITPGFQFVFCRRLQEIMILIPIIGRPLRRIFWWLTCLIFSAEIAIAAKVGGGLYVPHPYGIVVGSATLGRRVSILQNVTIGRRDPADPRDPVIADNVWLSAGAVILGPVTVGEGSVVAANAVVVKDVPPHSIAMGIPAEVRPRGAPAEAGRTIAP